MMVDAGDAPETMILISIKKINYKGLGLTSPFLFIYAKYTWAIMREQNDSLIGKSG